MNGPLSGVRIIEIGGIGPAPFSAMMLADNGADVIRIVRPGVTDSVTDVLGRSRRTVTIDLKSSEGVAEVRGLIAEADGLIEGFRPGTMERLGLGPDVLHGDNGKLVYGRMTGWGQAGPYANWAGHDINYIALSGALHAIGRAGEKPVPPLALVGDFGGGGMFLAFAMTAALLFAQKTGCGQVVDCSMTEGAGLLMAAFFGMVAEGSWRDERGANFIDGAAHFYDVYETADKRYISIGAIEPQFYHELRLRAGVADDPAFDAQMDRGAWPHLKERLAAIFKTKTREEWCADLEQTDACFAPVLSMIEAASHRHAIARNSFVTVNGVVQPAPGPRYSVSVLEQPRASSPVDRTQPAWGSRDLG
jgi:alpha-methylacyl-CoA racemase